MEIRGHPWPEVTRKSCINGRFLCACVCHYTTSIQHLEPVSSLLPGSSQWEVGSSPGLSSAFPPSPSHCPPPHSHAALQLSLVSIRWAFTHRHSLREEHMNGTVVLRHLWSEECCERRKEEGLTVIPALL